jgi:hypothetical protein
MRTIQDEIKSVTANVLENQTKIFRTLQESKSNTSLSPQKNKAAPVKRQDSREMSGDD